MRGVYITIGAECCDGGVVANCFLKYAVIYSVVVVYGILQAKL